LNEGRYILSRLVLLYCLLLTPFANAEVITEFDSFKVQCNTPQLLKPEGKLTTFSFDATEPNKIRFYEDQRSDAASSTYSIQDMNLLSGSLVSRFRTDRNYVLSESTYYQNLYYLSYQIGYRATLDYAYIEVGQEEIVLLRTDTQYLENCISIGLD